MTTATKHSLWQQALEDPALQDLPYKIESNERGQLVLSPQSYPHGIKQIRIGSLLEKHTTEPGVSAAEVSLRTSKGVKIPDVTWASEGRNADIYKAEPPLDAAPEICVEVMSKTNTEAEMEEKRALYFEVGAEEVWVCDEDGRMTFYDADGERSASALAPDFPKTLGLKGASK